MMNINGNALSSGSFEPNGNPLANGHTHLVAASQPYEDLAFPDEVAAIWQRRAAELAKPLHIESDGATLDLLIFSLKGERYGIKVDHVREIYPSRHVTPVPRTPEFVVGVFSARGRLLSIVDLHALLGLPKINLTNESKIIVVTSNDNAYSSNDPFELGFLADDVEDVVTIFEDDLTPMLSNQMEGQAEYTLGITAEMLIVLNLETLLQNKRLIVYEEI